MPGPGQKREQGFRPLPVDPALILIQLKDNSPETFRGQTRLPRSPPPGLVAEIVKYGPSGDANNFCFKGGG